MSSEHLDWQCSLDKIVGRAMAIYEIERTINPDQEVWMLTWCPSPKELPDADFYLQHNVNIRLLSDFLKGCSTGCFCVEPFQSGSPHYHGWYQPSYDPVKEQLRIACVKTMQHFGDCKFTKAVHYKIDKWYETRNCLHYYKKQLLDQMLTIDPNPITKDTVSTVNFDVLPLVSFLSTKGRRDKYSEERKNHAFRRDFYTDTIKIMN